MTELKFKLEVFEGPLDLLLHLIAKHKLNIHDIAISALLEQYLSYIDQAREQNLELAGEFLEMAAKLIYIKTISLLPKQEEAEKAKQELQGTLIEYAIAQAAALRLQKRFTDDIFVRKPVKLLKVRQDYHLQHSPDQLAQCYAKIRRTDVFQKVITEKKTEKLAEKITDTVRQKKIVSVSSRIIYVLRQLYDGRSVPVNSLYENITDHSARVAIFLAILELIRFGRTILSEDNTVLCLCEKYQKSRKAGDVA
ncbi:MAG: segregation/condensation protein A [Oscillospiraceae bacterium]|nr:segregation/condensation protein A [Oscillospiraceae bacterium]